MAEVTLTYPALGLTAPKSWGSPESIEGMIKKIYANYGTYLDFVAKESNLPKKMIAAFIAVESGGKVNAGANGSLTQGLMQWNRNYAKATLEKELKEGRLTDGERQKLASYGIKFDSKGRTRAITNADQLKPELNILIGTITLGQLIDTEWGTENGEIKLDRVIAVYNAGAYGDAGKKARSKAYKTPKDLASAVNPITSSYIRKILGEKGALDLTKAFTNA